ncbi:hypothetical protein MSAN_00223200 [Mycena sanguinolenta]|uniref:F-box domain-containing protein n=1 Tax=Mycena sanguinolenta TaxID=230812 RepID=A0A8H6ZFE1_9AGAR|nr:hypothetical protein MSAN_00223200 [Mycena sanguinolenta]
MEFKEPVLPQELFDHILDNLADDLETLRSCVLVSSSFYQRARIFSHFRVGALDGEHSISAFYKLLEGSPAFSARVGSLHLDDTPRSSSWISSMTSESRETQLLSHLVCLSRLCISSEQCWTAIPGSFRESIQLTLARPNLTHLELTEVEDLPLPVLAHCPALRSLMLTWVSFELDEHEDFTSAIAACAGSPPTPLEHLTLVLVPSMLEYFGRWILLEESPLDISCLQSLACQVHARPDYIALQPLLTASASTLHHLRLVKGGHHEATVDLRGLRQLHTLSFDACPPIPGCMRSLASTLVFPQPEQPIALVLTIYTNNTRKYVAFADADRTLADLPCIASVTLLWLPRDCAGEDSSAHELIDVSDEFVPEMPLLVNRLRGTGALRVLQSAQLLAK